MKTTNSTTSNTPDLTLAQRVVAPTPKFFRTIRTIGLILGIIGTAVLTAPVTLPAVVVSVGGYLAVAGGIATSVAQTAVGKE